MNTSRAKAVYHNYLNGKATEEEKAIIQSWYLDMGFSSTLSEKGEDYESIRKRILDNIIVKSRPVKKVSKLWNPFAVSAAAILLLAGTVLLLFNNRLKSHIQPTSQYVNDIRPGKKTATLTLANGKKIILSSTIHGKFATEPGVSITKADDGQLIYTITKQGSSGVNLNTLTTGRGETYQVHLPDGSIVWLNAASSLAYTSTLTDQSGKRNVKLTGEGYFEIAKDKQHPFVVQSRGYHIEVLGTHFNVNAYEDEPAMKTTLLEGSVKIDNRTTLKPNEQAVITNKGISIIHVIGETTIDWKGDAFNFRKEELQSIMRKISRWYDVTIEYDGVVDRGETFTGYISRDENVSKVIQTLSKISNLKFELNKKKIIISDNQEGNGKH